MWRDFSDHMTSSEGILEERIDQDYSFSAVSKEIFYRYREGRWKLNSIYMCSICTPQTGTLGEVALYEKVVLLKQSVLV